MKVPPLFWVGLGVGLVALVGVAWAGKRVGQVVAAVAPKLTPASPENVIYRDLIGGTGRVLSQDEGWTLGGWVRSVTSSDDEKIRAMLRGAPPISASPYPDF